jgi:dTDP-glucose 4,6-dehydratase
MNKRVLVTGGAGFIAHNLIHRILTTTDWDVITVDRLDYSGNLNRLHDILSELTSEQTKRLRVVFHDLKAELNPQIQADIGPVNYILHLAAGSHVDRSIDYPMEFVMDNVVGTANILEFARTQENLDRFVYFSTDEVFGPAPGNVKYKERDRYNSTNPYSATKAGAEELCVAYENTYGLPVYVTHTMNVFGERQHPEKYIPMVIRKARDGEVVTVHSDTSKTIAGSRHYIHTDDVSDAIMFLLDQSDKGLVIGHDSMGAKCPKFNIVGKEEIDNLELARMIAGAVGNDLNYEMVDFHSARPGHDLRYALDGAFMKSLGWEPAVSLRGRIEQVVTWTLANERWMKV